MSCVRRIEHVGVVLYLQYCAATSTVNFARPAQEDVAFGRVAADVGIHITDRCSIANFNNNVFLPRLEKTISQAPAVSLFESFGVLASTVHESGAPICDPTFGPQNAPMFARPAEIDAILINGGEDVPSIRPVKQQAPVADLRASGDHWAPQTSLEEGEFGYVLYAVLPGVKARDMRVELSRDRRLVISGYRREHRGGQPHVPELFKQLPEVFGLPPGDFRKVRDGQVLASGRFRVSWHLPRDADEESLRAEVKVRLNLRPVGTCVLLRVSSSYWL